MKESAITHSNIAFIKYWGKASGTEPELNIPSNDGVSMTKYGISGNTHLQTHTTIEFSDKYDKDIAILNNKILTGRNIERVHAVVNPMRNLNGITEKFKMMSINDFPTQAGLASSASGFAAIALATNGALKLNLSKKELTTYARLGSGSASRSIHGGFVYWHRGTSHETSFAEKICEPKDFEMNALIVIIDEGKKRVTSDIGHTLAKTSIFNDIRITNSNQQAVEIKEAINDDDFNKVGMIAEKNSLYMHTVMMTSSPPLFYWQPLSLRVIKAILEWRQKEKIECFFTIDAGPNIHILCRPESIEEVKKLLHKIEHIDKFILAEPAQDSYTTINHLF